MPRTPAAPAKPRATLPVAAGAPAVEDSVEGEELLASGELACEVGSEPEVEGESELESLLSLVVVVVAVEVVVETAEEVIIEEAEAAFAEIDESRMAMDVAKLLTSEGRLDHQAVDEAYSLRTSSAPARSVNLARSDVGSAE
jgi:hypothetical protein